VATYIIMASHYVEEICYLQVEAIDEAHAILKAKEYADEYGCDWQDGDNSKDLAFQTLKGGDADWAKDNAYVVPLPSDEKDADDDPEDDGYPPKCTDPEGHAWVSVEFGEQCYCEHCGADGNA